MDKNIIDIRLQKEKNLRLEGYSIDNEEILKEFDSTYQDSQMIKSLKMGNQGFYSTAKILNEKKIEQIDTLVEDKIKEATGTIITMKEIAKEIGRSEVTAGKYLKALTNCDFGDGYKITKKLKYDIEKGENGENDYIICLGTQINSGLEWKNETKP